MICGTSHLETAVPKKTTIQQDSFKEEFGTRGCTVHSQRKQKLHAKITPTLFPLSLLPKV